MYIQHVSIQHVSIQHVYTHDRTSMPHIGPHVRWRMSIAPRPDTLPPPVSSHVDSSLRHTGGRVLCTRSSGGTSLAFDPSKQQFPDTEVTDHRRHSIDMSVHVYTHVHRHVCTGLHTCSWTCLYTSAHMSIDTSTHFYTRLHT